MPESFIYRTSNEKSALRQGEILTGVIQIKPIPDESSSSLESMSYQPITHPYAIIITQDCDLDWDYKARQNENSQGGSSLSNKFLNSILLCQLYTAQDIRSDKSIMTSAMWNSVRTNRHEQYYFFQQVTPECELRQEGLPELTVDFKKVFAIEAGFLYYQVNVGNAQRRAILASPYLEHFSHHYYSFHSRVALPAPHESEKGN
jgi:hypothetical protein